MGASDLNIRTGRHCIFALHAHLVFVTKYRSDVFQAQHPRPAGADLRRGLRRLWQRPARVQRRGFPRPLPGHLPAQGGARQARQLPQGRVLSAPAPGLPGVGSALLARPSLVGELLRRVGRRRPPHLAQPVHRATGSTRWRFTTGLKAGAVRRDSVESWAGRGTGCLAQHHAGVWPVVRSVSLELTTRWRNR